MTRVKSFSGSIVDIDDNVNKWIIGMEKKYPTFKIIEIKAYSREHLESRCIIYTIDSQE